MESSTPLRCATVAAPIRKLCPQDFGSNPASERAARAGNHPLSSKRLSAFEVGRGPELDLGLQYMLVELSLGREVDQMLPEKSLHLVDMDQFLMP